ncbi:MAG: response regulator [Blastocatellia bacterium]
MTDPGRILLVEDDELDAELTLAALADQKLAGEIIVAPDGLAALDYLYRRGEFDGRAEGNPALVLLDLKLPKIDGLEVLRQIKSDDALKTIPVVMLTSSREEGDLISSYQMGVNAYVVKPVDFHEFTETVQRIGLFWSLINETPPRQL